MMIEATCACVRTTKFSLSFFSLSEVEFSQDLFFWLSSVPLDVGLLNRPGWMDRTGGDARAGQFKDPATYLIPGRLRNWNLKAVETSPTTKVRPGNGQLPEA
uniref:(northern house mosquito) hypothetical protein n=1 Tax=Culex pipiens TaxID=7175 RepID=A0A8D8FVU1_CULPI